MYTGVLDQNWIRIFHRSIVYPIKRVLADRITSQARPIDIFITGFRDLCLRKTFDMVDTISNIQLDDLKSKPHGLPESKHYKLFPLDMFHGSTHH